MKYGNRQIFMLSTYCIRAWNAFSCFVPLYLHSLFIFCQALHFLFPSLNHHMHIQFGFHPAEWLLYTHTHTQAQLHCTQDDSNIFMKYVEWNASNPESILHFLWNCNGNWCFSQREIVSYECVEHENWWRTEKNWVSCIFYAICVAL